MRHLFFSILVILVSLSAPAYAVNPGEQLDDPVLEARARALSQELRCLVCQNQSIDGSDAPLARDLRILVRERLTAGDSDAEVIDFLVARYGEFVLLRPRFNFQTLMLWTAPFGILLVGGISIFLVFRRRSTVSAAPAPLSEAEKTRLEEIVTGRDEA